jgi:hypothetical protein
MTVSLCILFSSCQTERQVYPDGVEKTIDLRDFSRIKAGETFVVTIKKGAAFSIKAKGRQQDLDDLAPEIDNAKNLHLKYRRFENNRYRIDFTITMPAITTINLDGSAKASVSGFAGQEFMIRHLLYGNSACTIDGVGDEVQVDMDGQSTLNISGNTTILYGDIKGQSRVNAFGLLSDIVEINTSGQTKTFVQPIQNLIVAADGQSEVYYKGNPPGKDIAISGQAKVVSH